MLPYTAFQLETLTACKTFRQARKDSVRSPAVFCVATARALTERQCSVVSGFSDGTSVAG